MTEEKEEGEGAVTKMLVTSDACKKTPNVFTLQSADVTGHSVSNVTTRAWLRPHVQSDVTERRVFLVLRSPDSHRPELQQLEKDR